MVLNADLLTVPKSMIYLSPHIILTSNYASNHRMRSVVFQCCLELLYCLKKYRIVKLCH